MDQKSDSQMLGVHQNNLWFIKVHTCVAANMARRLEVLAALGKDQGSVPSTHAKTKNLLFQGTDALLWPPQAPAHTWDTGIQEDKIPLHTKLVFKKI